ncbi:MAG: hypothetical protein KDA42_12455 [Planctomycetales bacterium]|nr:hypothetical protein [Planctomycetales bacterium]
MSAAHLGARPGRVGRQLLQVIYDHPVSARPPVQPHVRPVQAIEAWREQRSTPAPQWQREMQA